jgi:hypothetical protein
MIMARMMIMAIHHHHATGCLFDLHNYAAADGKYTGCWRRRPAMTLIALKIIVRTVAKHKQKWQPCITAF